VARPARVRWLAPGQFVQEETRLELFSHLLMWGVVSLSVVSEMGNGTF